MAILVNFLPVPLLLDIFDKEQYGIWLTITSIVTWFALCDIAPGNGLRNKPTESLTQKEQVRSKQLVSTTYIAMTVSFTSLGLLFIGISHLIDFRSLINNYSLPQEYIRNLAIVVFTIFALRSIFQLLGIICIAWQKPSVNNLIFTTGNTLALISLIVLKQCISHNRNLSKVELKSFFEVFISF